MGAVQRKSVVCNTAFVNKKLHRILCGVFLFFTLRENIKHIIIDFVRKEIGFLMKFLRLAFLSVFICLFCVYNSAMGIGECYSSGPRQYCLTNQTPDCPKGCWCKGAPGDDGALDKHGNDQDEIYKNDVENWCAYGSPCEWFIGCNTEGYDKKETPIYTLKKNKDNTYSYRRNCKDGKKVNYYHENYWGEDCDVNDICTVNTGEGLCGTSDDAGIYRCPAQYPNSEVGTWLQYDCYTNNEKGEKQYFPFYCAPGYFVAMTTDERPESRPCGGNGAYYCPGGCFEVPHTNRLEQGRYDCPAGYTCDNKGIGTKCPAGTEKSYTGIGNCTPCGEGEYSEEGWAQCKQCPSGYWCEEPGKERSKQPCPEGHYCVGGNAFRCQVGTYSNGGVKSKEFCDPNSQQDCGNETEGSSDGKSSDDFDSWWSELDLVRSHCFSNSSTSSDNCEVQKCTNLCNPNVTDCSEKPLYVIKETFPVVACTACPVNTYGKINEDGIPVCERCGNGTYNPEVGAVGPGACTPNLCGLNQYRDSDGTCTNCPVGSIVNDTQDGCYICPIGTYASDGKCIECGDTKYTEEPGATSCKSCPRDKVALYTWGDDGERTEFIRCVLPCSADSIYVIEKGEKREYCAKLCDGGYGWVQSDSRGSCEKCPDGTYRSGNDTHNALCQPCAEGTFSFGPGKEQCTTCPPGACCIKETVGERVIAKQYQCNRGTYSTGTRPASDGTKDGNYYCINDDEGKCHSCPDGTTTVNKGAKGCDECVPTVAKYCIDENTCFEWPTKINIYQNDIERQNMTIPPLKRDICPV